MKTLVLIDSHALIHRCFHALPPLTTPQGKPIGAVYGTANIILRMLREIKPDYIAACFDLAEPTFRHQEYKEYKAKRAKTPEDLTPQFEAMRQLYDAFDIKYFEKGGFEADDVIGSLAIKFSNQVDKTIIVTGDLDTLQLIDDEKIMVYTMKRGVQETMVYDEKAVRERFGLSPKQMVDFKGLKGDPSDNIPGVFGIGEKGAIKILQKFSNLENLYQEIERPNFEPTKEFNEKLLAKLRDQKEQALFSKYLASIRTDLEFNVPLSDLAFNELDQEKIIPLFKEWRFDSLINRLRGSQTSLAEINPNSDPVAAPSDLKDLINGVKDGEEIIIFKETEALAIFWKGKIFIANYSQKDLEQLAPILTSERITKIGYDFKELYKNLSNLNIPLAGLKHDVKIAAWLLNSDFKDYSLGKVWQKSFQTPFPQEPPVLTVGKIKKIQEQKIREWELNNVFENIEMPLIPILAKMEMTGVKIDKTYLEGLNKKIGIEIAVLEKEIHQLVGSSFNIGSPKQLSEILFKKLGIPTKGLRKTPAGVVSTQELELVKIKELHPVITLILRYRQLTKLQTTYIEPLSKLGDQNQRIHTNYNQTGTATGRLSSDNPNLQNIPNQGEWAKEIRRSFIAEKNHKLLSLDYSQIELRIAAALSQDEKMTAAFNANKDIHTLTAAEVNNVDFNEVTTGMRRQAKTLNFGVLYGMGSRAFSETTGLPKTQAQKFIEEYYSDFVGVKNWQEKIKAEGKTFGFIKTLTGRRRWVLDLASENQKYRSMAERISVNFPIQGLAADIIKLAMIKINKKLEEEEITDKIKIILQIHDELIFEVEENFIASAEKILKEEMEKAFPLAITLKAESGFGHNLAETD
jgi:DNA polymerase-1